MIALLLTLASAGGLFVVANAAGAGSVGFAITAALLSFGLAPFVGDSLQRRIPDGVWAQLSLSSTAARRWGVDLFNAILSTVGWNRHVLALRKGRSERPTAQMDPRHMRAAALGHAWAFALHIVSTVLASAYQGQLWAAALLIIGIVGHLYPVLLQLRILTRLRLLHTRLGADQNRSG
ncbi:hypothetical protein HMPREF3172_02520 [Brevibacterium sp. HMSC08F02]|uniref:glycosyl-4,4'-diaponeurosporenoate acyltransferase CrtO family protein n=1 Tax=Brevibacterium sp. HMSC08F02 TaxID=1581140 RepID=UPI0008A10880|nr:hypothetical protein [Brevibacterium sp. HMSC08F02]OFT26724.1 hypothetical protein HMPREF3172_02520 [Brevibacterium sp. HMSC08F02]